MRYSNQKEFQVVHQCARCGKKAVFINTRRFRVNANKIPKELYEGFLANDGDLAARYGSDKALFKRNHFVVKK